MSPFTVSIEVGTDRWTTAWVAEFPGLFVNEPSDIAQHLRHIAGAGRWYLTRLALGPFPDLGRTTDPIERLARVRRMVVARLRRLTAAERARIIKIEHEWWSARKMLGRFLYHERYHLRSMARIARHHGLKVPPGPGGWPRY